MCSWLMGRLSASTFVVILSDISSLKDYFTFTYSSFDGTVLVPEGQSHSPTSPSPQLEEMEPRFLEFEQDPPNWRELASPEALASLSKKERKRQEVINGTQDSLAQHAVRRLPWKLSVLNPILFSVPCQSCMQLSMLTCGCWVFFRWSSPSP